MARRICRNSKGRFTSRCGLRGLAGRKRCGTGKHRSKRTGRCVRSR